MGGGTFLLWNTVAFCYYLFIYFILLLFYFFIFLFVCVCIINFCGSFVILFWCYLIKNEIIITKEKVFSNTVLSILRHVRFTGASFEPITFLPIFHLQEKVHFGSWYLQKFNMMKETCNFSLINQLFRSYWTHYRNRLGTINFYKIHLFV